MNITKFDITILVTTFLAISLMTFTMPALGLVGDEAQENDIPEFEIEDSRFDIIGDLPDRPDGPNQATLKYNEEKDGNSQNQVWWYGDTSDGVEVVLTNDNNENVSDPAALFTLNDWRGGTLNSSTAVVSDEGDYAFLSTDDGAWEFQVEVHRFENVNESDMTIVGQTTALERETNDNWFFSVAGQLWSSAEHMAGVGLWLVTVLLFWIITGFEIMLNALGMVYDVMVYFVGLFTWLINEYTTIATAEVLANWAKVLMLTPLVLLMGELAKLVVLIVHVIWIG